MNSVAQTSAKNKVKNSRFLEFSALASIPIVLVLGNSMLVPILPDLQAALGISRFQSTLIITLFSLTAGLVIPVIGYLSDRYSRKKIIIPSLIVYGSAGLLAACGAMWNSYTIIMIARILQGIGAAGTAPIAMALIGDLYQGSDESKALGLIEASNGIGKVMSPIIGSMLALIVWYAPFFVFPLFCVIALLAVIFMLKEPERKQSLPSCKIYLRQILQVFKQKGRWLIPCFVAGSIGLFLLFGVLFYLSQWLEEPPLAIDGIKKGLVLAIPLLGLVVTSYGTGAIIKKNGTRIRKMIVGGVGLLFFSLVLCIFFYDHRFLLIGSLTWSGIGTGMLLPCLNTLITGSVVKEQRGMITSLYSSLRFIGVAVGPPFFEFLMHISHQMVFICVSILAGITWVLVYKCIKPEAQLAP